MWDALRDVGAIHTRLAPDFVTDVKLEGDARIVTFANGMVAKELIVDRDDAARRLVWSVVEGRDDATTTARSRCSPKASGCRLVWIADLLPNELAGARSAA